MANCERPQRLLADTLRTLQLPGDLARLQLLREPKDDPTSLKVG